MLQVRLLEGDMNSDNLGLSEQDLQTVQTQIQIVMHSAASIELEADVQHTLRSNYLVRRMCITRSASAPARLAVLLLEQLRSTLTARCSVCNVSLFCSCSIVGWVKSVHLLLAYH